MSNLNRTTNQKEPSVATTRKYEHVRGWHKGHWYGNEDETDSAYIQRGIAALLDGREE